MSEQNETSNQKRAMAFSFGDPEPILGSNLTEYLGLFYGSGDYYEPPVSMKGLAKIRHANAHHGTMLTFKRNQLAKHFIESELLPLQEFTKNAHEYGTLGNSYFKVHRNPFGQILRLSHLPGVNIRRMKEPGRYCQLRKDGEQPIEFNPGEVLHIKEYDIEQEVYGIPDYFGGIQSVLLNESATLFRRKYYDNGAHMGYIFYVADGEFDEDDETALKEKIAGSKGVGNFRSMFLNLPGGRKDSVQIIPVGDIATKDEFDKIKNISRNDIISMHRVPPALAGVMPENVGGFGDVEKIQKVYYENEVVPMQQPYLALNNLLPKNRKIQFKDPQ